MLDAVVAFTGVSPGALLIAMAVTAIAATLQGTVGLGFGLVSVPTLAMVDPRLSPIPQMLVILPLVLSMAWSERHGIDWTGFGQIVLGELPGAALGYLLVEHIDRAGLELAIAVLIGLAVVVAMRNADRAPEGTAPPSGGMRFAAGWVSGTSSYVAGIGGPPIALLYRNASGPTLRGTLAAIFAVGLTITITSRTTAGHITLGDVRIALVLLPFVLLGLRLSRALKSWVEGPRLRRSVLLVSGAAALALAVRTLVG